MAIARGESRQRILEHLKRHGSSTIPAIAADVDLNVETVRDHLKALVDQGLVQRDGTRSRGPGRPEIVYGPTDAAEALFPNRQGELLEELAAFLENAGEGALVERFFAQYVARRRAAALPRVEDLEGRERIEEVARILSEEGFMAEVEEAGAQPVLRLCHCPMRQLVSATRVPCRAEMGFVRELLGERLARVGYIPSGDAACRYAVGQGSASGSDSAA